MKPSNPARSCPCDSGLPLPACCGGYLEHHRTPPTAEALMRSRYTAYVLRDAEYLLATWDPAHRPAQLDLRRDNTQWLGLQILATEAGGEADEQGRVEFVARFRAGGRDQELREDSRFRRDGERWLYVDGRAAHGPAAARQAPAVAAPATGRNEACPCGSGQKFKRCCGGPSGKKLLVTGCLLAAAATLGCGMVLPEPPHNVLLFVADGLRPSSVSTASTPALAQVRASGTFFKNSHSLFPTLTMTNAASLATGFGVGTTGVFGNYLYAGFQVASAGDNPAPFLEQDAVLGEIAGHYDGNFVGEHGLLSLARAAGLQTAAVGKLGPTLLQDLSARGGTDTFVFDDSTGSMSGVALDAELMRRMQAAGLPLSTPARGDNSKRGDFMTPGTLVANTVQQQYFLDVTTKVLLPLFSERGRPFLLVYWSRDPDGTQHNQGDSLNKVIPGINGPTALAAVQEADRNLAVLRTALAEQNLADTTDVIVTSDHGFSTISKGSASSYSRMQQYADVPMGFLPPGFLAIDLAQALGLPLYDGEQLKPMPVRIDATSGQHPKTGDGILGADPQAPEVVIAVNGNADLVYLPGPGAATLLPKIVDFLLTQDYVSGLWVDDSLGAVAGTLPLSQIGLAGAARTPRPALLVGFASGDTGCGEPAACGYAVTDWYLQQGQGFHGSFGRADIFNNMAAVGPDFRAGYVDLVPASNADLGVTMARILGLPLPADPLRGRLLSEALLDSAGAPEPPIQTGMLMSQPGGPQQLKTVVRYQDVDGIRYFDAGGFVGRTNGL